MFVYTNNQYSSFSNHTQIKLIKKFKTKKHVNSKLKVMSNTISRISRFRTADIYRRTDRLGQLLDIKIVFPNQLTMFAGILLKLF